MIANIVPALALIVAFLALPAMAQESGPVRTVPNTGPVRTVPDAPPPAEVAPSQATPDDASPTAEDGRFVFHRVDDSFVRLDTRTGQVSLCSRRTVGWTCQVAPDDRNVLEREIARLRGDNAVLKKELLKHGISLPGGIAPPPASDKSRDLRLPTGADFNRVVTFVKNAWKRLVEIIVNLQKDVMNKS